MLGTEKEMATKVAGILGKKVGMTQLFDSKGDVRPVTVLQAGPCVVTQHKSATRDGYEAAQIGLVEFVKESRLTKPARGHLAKHNLPPVKFMREVPLEVEGTAGGGMVTVKLSAKGDMKSLQVDAALMKPDEKEIVEDLVVTAHADARRKAEALLQEKMKSLTGGLPLPPGLKF